MHNHDNRGVTLIELLVTMVVSSVVLVGLGSIYMGAASDFRMAARLREDRYSRQGLEAELVWRMKNVPPDFLPSQAQLPLGGPPDPGFTINYVDDAGVNQPRRILAFDYLVNDTRTKLSPFPTPPGWTLIVDGPGCPVTVPRDVAPEKIDMKTAAIFQYQSAVYVVERPMTAVTDSFRMMARGGALAGPLRGLFQTPPVPIPGATPPLPLAIGIDVFDVNIIDPPLPWLGCGSVELADQISKRRVEWRYTQYGAGR